MNAVARRVHIAAQYAAWMSLTMMVLSGILVWLMNTNAVVEYANHQDEAAAGGFVLFPAQVVEFNHYLPVFALVAGFVLVVSVMAGGFRRELDGSEVRGNRNV